MNEKRYYLIMYSGWAVAVLALCYMLSRGGIRDTGVGASAAGTELSVAQQSAAAITERIEKAEQRADSIREGLSGVTSVVERTGDEIRDCQQILEAVRRRGKIAETKD